MMSSLSLSTTGEMAGIPIHHKLPGILRLCEAFLQSVEVRITLRHDCGGLQPPGITVAFASGLDDPKGLIALQRWLFVADKKRVWRIDESGKAEVFAPTSSFPTPPLYLNDPDVDLETGILYVSDSGNQQGENGAAPGVPFIADLDCPNWTGPISTRIT